MQGVCATAGGLSGRLEWHIRRGGHSSHRPRYEPTPDCDATLPQCVSLLAGCAALADLPADATWLAWMGAGMQQAGWLGHDYVHGRGPWCKAMRSFAGWINGHSTHWWTQKHSMHHVFTNEHGGSSPLPSQSPSLVPYRGPRSVGCAVLQARTRT